MFPSWNNKVWALHDTESKTTLSLLCFLFPSSRLLHSSSQWEVLLQRHPHGPQEHKDWGRVVQVQHRCGPGGFSRVSAWRPGEAHGGGQTHPRSSGCLQHHFADGEGRHGLHRPRHRQAGLLVWTLDHLQRDAAVWNHLTQWAAVSSHSSLCGPNFQRESVWSVCWTVRDRTTGWSVRGTETTGLDSFSEEKKYFIFYSTSGGKEAILFSLTTIIFFCVCVSQL